MPFTYRQVKDLYDTLADAGAVTKPLAQWAGDMSAMTGSDLYDEGLHDNVIKRASVGIDRALEWTGLPKLGEEFGRAVSSPFGMGDQGAEIGHGLPRMAVNFLPAIGATALTSGAAAPLLTAAGMAGTGALSGAETYTATGSPAAGVLSGAINAFLPKLVGGVEQGILGRMGAREVAGTVGRGFENGIPKTLEAVKQFFPTTFGQRAASFTGGQAAAMGIMGGSEIAQQAMSGQDISNPFTGEFALSQVLGQPPFTALHLGGKLAGGGGKSPMEQANALQQAIDLTTRGVALKQARDASKEATPVQKIPEVKPTILDPKIQAETEALLSSLGQQRKDIESNPTPENIDKLDEIKAQEDSLGQKQYETTGGVGLGFSRPETGTVPIVGEGHFYGNKQGKPETGFHIVTVKENPNDALKYADGTPVMPGDRIQWPAGRKDPGVNNEVNDNFLVPRNRFSKIEDKAMEQNIVQESKQPNLPDQSGGDPVSHVERLAKAQADHAAWMENHKINLDDLENLKQDLSLRGTLSYGELVDGLQEVNKIRSQAGYPEIDLATLVKTVKETGVKSRKAGLLSAIEETKRFQLVEQAAQADSLVNFQANLQKEVATQTKITEQAANGNQQSQKILDIYEELSADAGNRGLLASSGLFWKEAEALDSKGQLTVPRLMARVNAIVQSPKGPKGMLEKAPTVELPPTIFKALTSEEKTAHQLGAEAVLKITAGDANSDEAKVLRQLIYNGDFSMDKDAIVQAVVDAGVEDEGAGANLFAEDWVKSPKVQGWMKELGNLTVKNELPEPQFKKTVDLDPFALRDTSDIKQLPAGGGFVWGMASYDPVTNRLGDKHTLPKSGEIKTEQLKAIGGRGKPLQDVEIDMMKSVDQAVGGGAFDGKGNVNVRKLDQVLKDNPIQVESHVYGQDGKESKEKERIDQLTHDWLDNLPAQQRQFITDIERGNSSLPWVLQDNPELKANQDWVNKATEYFTLKEKVRDEPDFSGPRATSYYNSISPFDTKKYPVVRVDVVLPHDGKTVTKADEQAARDRGEQVPFAGADRVAPLWNQDNLHENLPNTLGWAMVQFVPDPRTGETVMFVGEQQSRWGQERNKFRKSSEDTGGQRPWTADDQGIVDHPLLPFQHVLVLKAAAQEAAKRGVTKMVVSDGETAMMTEMHDKQNANHWEVIDKAGNLTGTFPTKEAAEKYSFITDTIRQAGIKQEGGMRLHYDTTLASAAKKLTGDKGEMVDMGVHKNTLVDGGQALGMVPGDGSPIFRNPDGSPKSFITGRVYDLSSIQEISKQQGGLTLGDPARVLEEPKAYDPKDIPEQAVVDQLTGDGNHILQSVTKDPLLVGIAKNWMKQFPNLLARQDGLVHDGVGSYARMRTDGLSNRLYFDKAVVAAKPEARENTIIHEMAHGLTQQLIDEYGPKHPLVKELDGIRMRARQALSPELKSYLDSAESSGWLERYRRNQADPSELAPDASTRQILYGLLDNKEMTAQLFSSHSFREHFQGIDGKTGVWRKFLEWTKKMLGLGQMDNTLLGELMGATGQLMHKGEYLADMESFGQRWFENKGKGGTYGDAQTQRAMGILQEINDGISVDEMSSALGMGEGKFNPKLVKAKARLQEDFNSLDENTEALHSVTNELGHDPSVQGIDNLVEEAVTEGKDLGDILDVLPDSATKYIYEKLQDHADVLGVLEAATKAKNQGILNIAKPSLVRGPVGETLKRVNQILAHQDRHLEMAQNLVNLQGVEPTGFVNASAARSLPVEEFIEGKEKSTGGFAQWISRFLEPMAQKARRLPEMAEGISKGFELGPNARKMFSEAMKVFGMDTSSPNLDILSHDSVQQSQKVFQTPKELNVVNKWIHANQEAGKLDGVKMLPESNPEIQKLLGPLTQEERDRVRDMVAKQGQSTQMLNAQKLEKMKQIAAVSAAGHILKESGLKVKDAIGLADATIKAIVDMRDPVMQLTAQAQLQAVQARMQPEVFLELLKFSQGEAQKIGDWKEYFDKNPFWATAQRTERYHIKGRNGVGKQQFNQASSMVEAREKAEKLGIKNPEFVDSWKGREDEPFSFPNMPPEMAKRMGEIEENQIQMLKSSGVIDSPEAEQEYRKTSAVTQILREATNTQAIPGVSSPPRLLSQGAEELPWMWNHISNAQRESNYWSRQLLRAQARTYLRDPELASNESLRKDLATHYENLLHPDPEIAQKMTRFASTWFLGFNLASSMINAAQPFATHVGELTAISGKPIDSYKRVLRALNELGGRFLGKKEWASKDHEDFMNAAVKDGEVGIGMFDDEQAAQESIATNYKRAMMKNKSQSVGQRLGTASGNYSNVSMWVFQHGERLNARSALLASFDLYRDQGLSFEDAKQKAYEFNRSVNYSGGRAQRPVGAFSGRGAFPRTAAMLGTSLQSYVLGTTFQIARYLQKGAFRPTGATPHEVYAARKAAIQMLGTQFAAAGLLGMPFVSGAIGLLDKLFPDLELNKHIRQGVSGFLQSDKENGSVLTDIAMTGVPSMLGWDMQSRLSMGNSLPGVSEINGFQPENLMGPMGNVVRNFVGGVQGWTKGDPSASTAFLPPAIKKAVQLGTSVLTDGGEIRDYQGRPLANPTVGEKLGLTIGFQPKRLSDQNAASRIALQADQVQSRHESQDRMEMAQEVLKGNFGTVRNRLLTQARDDKNYNPQDAVKAIAQSAEELTFPRDLRREGSKASGNDRANLLSSFSNLSGVSPASELQRLQYRVGIEQKLGLPPRNLQGELAQAQMMDQLRLAQPQATRSQLRAIAQQQLRRSVGRQSMLQSIQE